MNRFFSSVLFNGGFLAAVVAGHVFGIEGARNVAWFLATFAGLPMALLLVFSSKLHSDIAEKPRSPFLRCLARFFFWPSLGVLCWFGAWWTAAPLAVFMFGVGVCHTAVDKIRDGKQAASA